MKSLGICIGASSISLVILKDNKINWHSTKLHEGDPKTTLKSMLQNLDLKEINNFLITGRKFKEFVKIPNITEPEAIENALEFLNIKDIDTIISAGGENFIVYHLDKNLKISKVESGNKCASGTGEFFLQQIKRMDLTKEKATEIGLKGTPHKISGRCSVFCKSDCTHALNKGEKKEDVVSGLCEMMANKILELLNKVNFNKVLLIGGTSQNKPLVEFLRKKVNLTIPNEATYFEALGTAYAAKSKGIKKININDLFAKKTSSFTFHKPLKNFLKYIEFKESERKNPKENDTCIIGLDVGSTTTKIILLRTKDNAILASEYLRTNGDPINASVECYSSIKQQLNNISIKIIGLGVTGSGRQISGLHALTKGIINEIIAHATGATYFDKEVDTIFEIGGQDAKYTYLTNGIASDYAMNEACSAGTGSFLEESAQESLGINYKEIGDIALKAKNPPNFNDQCAAFISSDIKNASHENLEKEDIVAGLVYSICMNYTNRVKGNRPMGKKIFMQGGVCYNKAVPIAMAALTGKKIIVPPEPGLIGAFGVALEIKKRIELKLLEKQEFNLDSLINRKVTYHKPFKCFGNDDGCDRACEISMLEVDGEKIPFGGACNKYYNLRFNIKSNTEKNDLVALRQKLVFEKYAKEKLTQEQTKTAKTIGITKSFLTNTYYPLYYNFFTKLGVKVILSEEVDAEGTSKIGSSFCYPVEISHGLFKDLINKKPDYIFLPHLTELEVKNEDFYKKACVFVQSEPYYLRTTFKQEQLPKLLTPVISFSKGIENSKETFIKIAKELGFEESKTGEAFDFAVKQQRDMFSEFKEIGKKALEEIEKENKFGIVLFGRPYNAFAKEANLNIPHKFASRNKIIIPYDFLPIDDEISYRHMYWATGNLILKAAKYIKKNPLLFGCFITNFSCGPDSFIISYFREIMKTKPSLTLELDSHSADAGINTRIEAALDIMESYLELYKKGLIKEQEEEFSQTKVISKNNKLIVKNNQEEIPLTDKRVKIIFSSMGELSTRALTAAFRTLGINCQELPVPTMDTLKTGRANTTCKECLPMILTTGGMIEYLNNRPEEEITLFFMPHGAGPCRQGQYHIYQENLIEKLKIKNAAVITSNDEKSYNEFGTKFLLTAWIAILTSECMEDIRRVLSVIAKNKQEAISIFNQEFGKIISSIETDKIKSIMNQIKQTSKEFGKIELTMPLEKAKIISLVGEVYVRREEFSRLNLIEILEKKGFIVLPTPASEYIYYCNHLAKNSKMRMKINTKHKIKTHLTDMVQLQVEKMIKKQFEKSKLTHYNLIDVKKTLSHSKHLIPEDLLGEAILTVGVALREIIDQTCGVISIGPFGCMPSRVAESILTKEMNKAGKEKASNKKLDLDIDNLPFLAIETDGNAYPQIIQSKLEIFMLQADRLHEKIMQSKK